ncbi:MAG: hypothetical protein O7A64_08135 [Alphaproteobacteria bacterium]|nr:hypothetical protein [Alphaproteobacteria bacterium]
MLKFGPTGFDPKFLSNPENLNLTEWFDAFPTDGGAGIPALAVDNPLTGLSLQLDSGFLDALFAGGGTTVGGDGAGPGDDTAPGFRTGISDDGPDVSISAAGTFEPGEHGFFATQVSEDFATGFRTVELPIDAISSAAESGPGAGGAPADSDLIFLDFGVSGKGGVPGGNGNGGGGKDKGGGDDPNVLSTYTSGDENKDDSVEYNIEINFKGSWTADLKEAFTLSADLISGLITEDIADVFWRGKIIDDIRIEAKLTEIDGEGDILGRAGPTAIRTDGFLPAVAIMEFDVADAPILNSMPSTSGTLGSGGTIWDDVVVHEMMHSIGFGTIWTYLDLLAGGDPAYPTFTGPNAIAAYDVNSFNPPAGYPDPDDADYGVPVEGTGGRGTKNSHWDEGTFDDEIMTGYIEIEDWGSTTNDSGNFLTDMTVASLYDLGYVFIA